MAITKTDVYSVEIGLPLDLRIRKTNISARDSIPTLIRYAGLQVYVDSEDAWFYWPAGATSNADWKPLGSSAAVGLQTVMVSASPPSGGADGDVWLQTLPGLNSLYQKLSGDWVTLATFQSSEGVTAYQDNTVTYPTTGASIDSKHPTAKIGDIVYNDNSEIFTKLAAGKWTFSMQEII